MLAKSFVPSFWQIFHDKAANLSGKSQFPTVVTTGFTPLDLVTAYEDPNHVQLFGGGTAGNVSAILASLGWSTHLIARLSDDEAGRIVTEDLRRLGVRLDYAHLAPTAATPVILQRNRKAPNGQVVHSFSPWCARCRQRLTGFRPVTLKMVEAIIAALPRPQIFFFDRVAPGVLNLARWAQGMGALLVFEPSSLDEADRHTQDALAMVHILKYSKQRLPDLADSAIVRTPLIEIETLGADGLRYRSAIPGAVTNGWRCLPAINAPHIVDTAGLGDWCTAGFLDVCGTAGLRGVFGHTIKTLERGLKHGQALAAQNCGFAGARGAHYQAVGAPAPILMPIEDAMDTFCPACRKTPKAARAVPWNVTKDDAREWRTVDRPGYVGRRQRSAMQKLDAEYGAENWRIVYAYDGKIITRDEALLLYAAAYVEFLRQRLDVLDWLVKMACDVYDIQPDDVQAGTDFSQQRRDGQHHLHDIALRIALQTLGRRFEGNELIQVRGKGTKGHGLSPGRVPFHRPEAIMQPELEGWWAAGTVEAFWQSNKLLQVRPRQTLGHIMVFGGSFNPIHNGHVALARHARDHLGFDQVVFVPNGDNYRKDGLAPAEIRLAMVEAAIAGERGFRASDVEVRSHEKMRTVKTMKEIRQQHPDDDLVLLRGLDALPRTHWKLFGIPGLRVLVVDRAGSNLRYESVLARHQHLYDNRDRIQYEPGSFSFRLSSSDVRSALTLGRSIDDLLPPAVALIIREYRLYGGPTCA